MDSSIKADIGKFLNRMRRTDPEYPYPTSSAVQAVMKANKRRDTKPEISLRKALHKLGYRFRKDFLIATEKCKCRPDIVFTKKKVAIFIDGCFWHSCPIHFRMPQSNTAYWIPKIEANVQKDLLHTESLRSEGWNVLRIWEHTSLTNSIDLIEEAINQSR